MTTEPTSPEETQSSAAQANPNAAGPNGPRQKQSFRRRRKRRGPGGNPAQPPGQPASNPAQANGAPVSGPQASQTGAAQNGAPRNENQPRKPKKRFFKKNKNPGQGQNQGPNQGQGQPNARNARGDSRGNGQQQQRRGSKQRRPKVFVGPMDHSYRAANGNYSDGPPSTIELQRGYTNVHYNGNGNGNFNGDHAGSANGRSVDGMEASANFAAALENSPTRIYCFIDDLFFMAKIQETARKLGIKVAFAKNDKDTVAQLLALPEEERPALIVFDLNNANAKPLTLIPKLKLKLKRATSIVGFLSHLQGELKAKAIEAGCDTVMPRSAFSQTLPNLLRRYGVEAEPELEDSQTQIIEA
jgi:hypothetical protein